MKRLRNGHHLGVNLWSKVLPPGREDKVAGRPGLGEALGLPESFLKGVCTGQGLA